MTNKHNTLTLGFMASAVVLGTAFAVSGTAHAADASLYHVPPAEANAHQPVRIRAQVSAGWTADVDIMYRALGEGAFRRAPFKRTQDDTYEAVIPSDHVMPPGLQYFIVSNAGGGSTAHFATAKTPHTVFVYDSAKAMRVDREMARYQRRRALARISYEFIDFGSRQAISPAGEQTVKDSFYRLDADFTYRVFRFPLRSWRIGFTRMLGTTPNISKDGSTCDPCDRNAGFRAGGWTELRWRLADGIDLDTRILIQATETGFGFGGRGELRLGRERGSHFAVGTEQITEIGSSYFVKLAWLTVPGFPMAASIELTDYPFEGQDHGVRLIYDVAHEFDFGLRVGGRVAYQARDQDLGGISGGGHVSVDF